MANWGETGVLFYEMVLVLISCFLSAAGSLLVLFTYALWPDLRTKPRRLLVFLSIADLLSALSYFYGTLKSFSSDTWDCITQGAVSTFSNTSSFFWTVSIAVYLYITIVRSRPRLADSLHVYFHLFGWGVPLAITIAAVCLQKIGYDASEVSVGWCWVSIKEKDHVLWMLLTGKIWELLAYIILPVLYILIKRHVYKAHAALMEYRPILANDRLSYSFSSMADRKLTFIPIIFIALRMWSTVRFVMFLLDSPARHNPVLVTLHGIGNSFQGAANCILFVLCTRPVRKRLVDRLCCRGPDGHTGSGRPPHQGDNSHAYSNPDDSSIPHIWQDEDE